MTAEQEPPADDNADGLRSVDRLSTPDARMRHFVIAEAGSFRSISQDDRHLSIASFELRPEVPREVRVHFDTARNLYLYAWFVYRFHVIAEQQALASLEMALRLRLIDCTALPADGTFGIGPLRKAADSVGAERLKKRGLSSLLKSASENGFISNDRCASRLRWAQDMAYHRVRAEQLNHMIRSGQSEMTVPDEVPVPTLDELAHDWIGDFIDSLPRLRNTYAHGSSMLHPSVLRTFDVVANLTNQLFAPRQADTLARP